MRFFRAGVAGCEFSSLILSVLQNRAAGLVIGYRSPQQHYMFAELGAARSAYSIGEFVSGFGWRPLAATGTRENLRADRSYLLEL